MAQQLEATRVRQEAAGEEEAQALAPPCRPRLLILDSHQLFRECLASALREDGGFDRVEAGESDETALPGPEAGGWVDVLLLGCSEAGRLRHLLHLARQRCPEIKVLVLGLEEGEQEAVALLRAGAKGYLFRDQSLAELRAAILEVADGARVCTPRIANLLFAHLAELGRQRQRDEQLDFLNLTARELEILRLIADGLKNQEIAERLYLSVHTVKNHVHNILERLGVKSRWSAVTHACDKGWLQARRRFPA